MNTVYKYSLGFIVFGIICIFAKAGLADVHLMNMSAAFDNASVVSISIGCIIAIVQFLRNVEF